MFISLNLAQTELYSELSVADGTLLDPICKRNTSHVQQKTNKCSEIHQHSSENGYHGQHQDSRFWGGCREKGALHTLGQKTTAIIENSREAPSSIMSGIIIISEVLLLGIYEKKGKQAFWGHSYLPCVLQFYS